MVEKTSIDEADKDDVIVFSKEKANDKALTERKKRLWKKSAILVVIAILFIVVVAIIIGVVSRQNGEDREIVDYSHVDGKEIYNTLEGIRDEIKKMPLDEALGYLDNQIVLYEGTELELEIRLLKAYYLNDNDLAEQAIEEIEKMDVDRLSDVYKMNYYSALRTIYDGLDDAEMYEKNNALYWEIYLDYYKGGAGG